MSSSDFGDVEGLDEFAGIINKICANFLFTLHRVSLFVFQGFCVGCQLKI